MEYKKYKRICVLDTETTSVYWNSAAPVQIAALILDEHGKILDEFNERIRTTHTIDPEASKIHGIYARDLKGCRPESEVLTDFCVWMKSWEVDAVLTYNGEAFDRPMLNILFGNGLTDKKVFCPFFNKDCYSHNSYLDFLYNFGIIGFVLTCGYLFYKTKNNYFLSKNIIDSKYFTNIKIIRIMLLMYALSLTLYTKRMFLIFFLL